MDHKEYRLAAIMFTDIVGFSRMMEKDETGTLALMEFHNEIVRRHVAAFGGKVIKTIGDAFLAEFPTATNAVKSAIEVQKELGAHNAANPGNPIVLRIGVHLGDIHFSENDALGEGINIASRLQSLSKPGRITISQEVYNLVSNKIDLPIQPLGAVTLKNISKGIHAYQVMTNGSGLPEEDVEKGPVPELANPPALPESSAPAVVSGVAAPAVTTGGVKEVSSHTQQPFPELNEREIADLRAFVMQQIKLEGRRLSIAEIRTRLKSTGPAVDAYLEKLADGGFLTRATSSPGMGAARPQGDPGAPHGDFGDQQRGPGSYSESYTRDRGGFNRPRDPDSSLEDDYEEGDPRRRHGRRGRGMYGSDMHEVFSDIGREIKSEIVDRVRNAVQYGGFDRKAPTFEEYVQQQEKRAVRAGHGLKSHLSSFLAVNVGLWIIWGATMFGGFPWPLIVNFAWGVGMASHWVNKRDSERELKMLKALPPLEEKPLGLLRRLFRERRNWDRHLVSTLATTALLTVINLVTGIFAGAPFFWAIFPIAGMSIGLFSHLPRFKSKEQEYLAELAKEGVPVDVLTTSAKALKDLAEMRLSQGATGPAGIEAEKIYNRILRQVKAMKGKHPLGDDFIPTLDNYIKQIRELSVRDKEIDLIIKTIPVRDLDREYETVKRELETVSNDRMRSEYEKSLEQIDKQKRAYEEMTTEQKVLKLRLNNSVSSLKQLELDLARMRSLSTSQDIETARAIKEKSGELSRYLGDLKAGYQEVDGGGEFKSFDEKIARGSSKPASAATPSSGDSLDDAFRNLEERSKLPGFDQPIASSSPETEPAPRKDE